MLSAVVPLRARTGLGLGGVVAAVESATVYRFDRPEGVAKPTVADDAYPVESADLPLTQEVTRNLPRGIETKGWSRPECGDCGGFAKVTVWATAKVGGAGREAGRVRPQ